MHFSLERVRYVQEDQGSVAGVVCCAGEGLKLWLERVTPENRFSVPHPYMYDGMSPFMEIYTNS
jgi:hypothetical protein